MTVASPDGPVLLVVVCSAGPAGQVGKLVELAQGRGWRVDVVATPPAVSFLNVAALEALTGSPVRSQYRAPGQPRSGSLPAASAIVVAPATYNTICKLAVGVNDTYALGLLAEGIGRGLPLAVLPFVNSALAARKPFQAAVASLREDGGTGAVRPG